MENGLLPAVPAVDNEAVGENGADCRRAARTATWFRPPRARPDAGRPGQEPLYRNAPCIDDARGVFWQALG
jgi:hypothetical protein